VLDRMSDAPEEDAAPAPDVPAAEDLLPPGEDDTAPLTPKAE
jgi:hypothetical protein